jgi:hypothetical protein
MARPPTGAIIEKRTTRGTSYALRFRAYGQRRYVTLGTTKDGWNRRAPKMSCRMSSPTCAAGSGGRLPPHPKLRSSQTRPFTRSRANGSALTGESGRPTPCSTTSGSCAITCSASSPSTGCPRSRSPRSTATAKARSTRHRSPPSRSTRRSPASGKSSRSQSSMSCSPATRSGSTPAGASSKPPRPGPCTSTAWIRSSRC